MLYIDVSSFENCVLPSQQLEARSFPFEGGTRCITTFQCLASSIQLDVLSCMVSHGGRCTPELAEERSEHATVV